MELINSFKRLLCYLYYNSLYFYNSLYIKKVFVENFQEVDVLCRGESLLHYDLKDLTKTDLIILANFEKNDLSKSGILKKINKIPCIIMSNNAEPIPYIHDLKKIILNDVYINKIVGDNKYGEEIKPKRTNFRLDSISKNVKFLNFSHYDAFKSINTKFQGSWNTGLFALFLACIKNPKKVNIYGMDFYNSEYYYTSLLDEMSENEKQKLKNSSNNFKKTFFGIVDYYKKINFYINTKANLSMKTDNLKIN